MSILRKIVALAAAGKGAAARAADVSSTPAADAQPSLTVDQQIEKIFEDWRAQLRIRQSSLEDIIAQEPEDKAHRLVELSDVHANLFEFQQAQDKIDEALRISRFAGTGTVRSFTYFITELCNLRCEHCFIYDEVAGPYLKRSDELPTESVIKIIKGIKKDPRRNVFLSGGEVFARPDFEEIVDGISADGLRFAFGTNGMFPKRLDAVLSKARVRECLDNVQFSIDGTKEAHERIRGKNTFQPLMDSIGIAQSHGVSINATTVIQEQNVDDMEAFDGLIKGLGLTHRYQLHAKGTRLQTPELERWRHHIGPGEFHMASLHPLIPGLGCLAGVSTASIRSNGVVEACRMSVVANVPKLILGDLKDYDFDIDSLMQSNRAQGTQNIVRECQGCALYCGR